MAANPKDPAGFGIPYVQPGAPLPFWLSYSSFPTATITSLYSYATFGEGGVPTIAVTRVVYTAFETEVIQLPLTVDAPEGISLGFPYTRAGGSGPTLVSVLGAATGFTLGPQPTAFAAGGGSGTTGGSGGSGGSGGNSGSDGGGSTNESSLSMAAGESGSGQSDTGSSSAGEGAPNLESGTSLPSSSESVSLSTVAPVSANPASTPTDTAPSPIQSTTSSFLDVSPSTSLSIASTSTTATPPAGQASMLMPGVSSSSTASVIGGQATMLSTPTLQPSSAASGTNFPSSSSSSLSPAESSHHDSGSSRFSRGQIAGITIGSVLTFLLLLLLLFFLCLFFRNKRKRRRSTRQSGNDWDWIGPPVAGGPKQGGGNGSGGGGGGRWAGTFGGLMTRSKNSNPATTSGSSSGRSGMIDRGGGIAAAGLMRGKRNEGGVSHRRGTANYGGSDSTNETIEQRTPLTGQYGNQDGGFDEYPQYEADTPERPGRSNPFYRSVGGIGPEMSQVERLDPQDRFSPLISRGEALGAPTTASMSRRGNADYSPIAAVAPSTPERERTTYRLRGPREMPPGSPTETPRAIGEWSSGSRSPDESGGVSYDQPYQASPSSNRGYQAQVEPRDPFGDESNIHHDYEGQNTKHYGGWAAAAGATGALAGLTLAGHNREASSPQSEGPNIHSGATSVAGSQNMEEARGDILTAAQRRSLLFARVREEEGNDDGAGGHSAGGSTATSKAPRRSRFFNTAPVISEMAWLGGANSTGGIEPGRESSVGSTRTSSGSEVTRDTDYDGDSNINRGIDFNDNAAMGSQRATGLGIGTSSAYREMSTDSLSTNDAGTDIEGLFYTRPRWTGTKKERKSTGEESQYDDADETYTGAANMSPGITSDSPLLFTAPEQDSESRRPSTSNTLFPLSGRQRESDGMLDRIAASFGSGTLATTGNSGSGKLAGDLSSSDEDKESPLKFGDSADSAVRRSFSVSKERDLRFSPPSTLPPSQRASPSTDHDDEDNDEEETIAGEGTDQVGVMSPRSFGTLGQTRSPNSTSEGHSGSSGSQSGHSHESRGGTSSNSNSHSDNSRSGRHQFHSRDSPNGTTFALSNLSGSNILLNPRPQRNTSGQALGVSRLERGGKSALDSPAAPFLDSPSSNYSYRSRFAGGSHNEGIHRVQQGSGSGASSQGHRSGSGSGSHSGSGSGSSSTGGNSRLPSATTRHDGRSDGNDRGTPSPQLPPAILAG